MLSLRRSTFETNSSSAHTITIQDVKNKDATFDPPIVDGKLYIKLTAHVKEPEIIYSPLQKLNYYLSYLIMRLNFFIDFSKPEYIKYEHINFDKIKLDKANKFLSKGEDTYEYRVDDDIRIEPFLEQMRIINEIIKEKTNAQIVLTGAPQVSHKAINKVENFLNNISKKNIENFLFNPDILVVIDSKDCKYTNQYTDNSGFYFGNELELNTKFTHDVTFKRVKNVIHNDIMSKLKLDYEFSKIRFIGVIVDDIEYDTKGLACYPKQDILYFKRIKNFEVLELDYNHNTKIDRIVIRRESKKQDITLPLNGHYDVKVVEDIKHYTYKLKFYRYTDDP